MNKPIYSVIAAATIDGRIAAHAWQFTGWTSKEDKDFLHKILDQSDVVLVGNNTYKTAREPLSKRNCVVLTRSVRGVVLKREGLVYLNPKNVNLKRYIKDKGFKRVVVLGGTQTFTYFLEKRMIDEIYLTIEPLVFGKGLNLFETKKSRIWNFKLVSVKRLNKKGSLLLHFKA